MNTSAKVALTSIVVASTLMSCDPLAETEEETSSDTPVALQNALVSGGLAQFPASSGTQAALGIDSWAIWVAKPNALGAMSSQGDARWGGQPTQYNLNGVGRYTSANLSLPATRQTIVLQGFKQGQLWGHLAVAGQHKPGIPDFEIASWNGTVALRVENGNISATGLGSTGDISALTNWMTLAKGDIDASDQFGFSCQNTAATFLFNSMACLGAIGSASPSAGTTTVAAGASCAAAATAGAATKDDCGLDDTGVGTCNPVRIYSTTESVQRAVSKPCNTYGGEDLGCPYPALACEPWKNPCGNISNYPECYGICVPQGCLWDKCVPPGVGSCPVTGSSNCCVFN